MSEKKYSSEEVLDLQSSAYQKGYNEGYQLRKEEQPSGVWVKANTWPPDHNMVHWRRVDDKKPLLVVGRNFQDNIIAQFGRVYTQNELEWLDESADVSQDAHEKEIMMRAFDKVRQIFEGRSWIMEGRGSYPYNDDRYKEEVRYMYDEFDKLFKETWGNIESKSFEYRKAIIAEYLQSPAASSEEDAVEKLKDSIDYYRGIIAGLGDSETDDFNRSVYYQHSGDLHTAIKVIDRYEKYFNDLQKQQKEK